MIVLDKLTATYSPQDPCAMTIGSFDGVHLGHQALLSEMRDRIGPKGTLSVLTFSNHPSHILPQRTPTPLISSKEIKLRYLEEYGVDVVFCIKFTHNLAEKPYDFFLKELYKACPFSLLLLGEGASLGRKRQGTAEKLTALGEELGYRVKYMEKRKTGKEQISSNRIRACILEGRIEEAQDLLGHPLVIEAQETIQGLIIEPEMCVPQRGSYQVQATQNGSKINSTITFEGKKPKIATPISKGPVSIRFI